MQNELTAEEIIHIYENSQLQGSFTQDGLTAAYVAALAALRAEQERTNLNCRGCVDFDENDRTIVKCFECKRLIRANDCYRTKPEGQRQATAEPVLGTWNGLE